MWPIGCRAEDRQNETQLFSVPGVRKVSNFFRALEFNVMVHCEVGTEKHETEELCYQQ